LKRIANTAGSQTERYQSRSDHTCSDFR